MLPMETRHCQFDLILLPAINTFTANKRKVSPLFNMTAGDVGPLCYTA